MRGSVKKDGSSWCVRFELGKDPISGKRKQKFKRGFKTKKEAEKYLTEQLNSIEKGTYLEFSNISFSDYMDEWLNKYAQNNTSPKTYEGYNSIIRFHLKPSLGGISLDKLKPIHLQNYYLQKVAEGLSEQTILHHHRLINKMLNDAVSWELLIRNVAQAVKPPKVKKTEMKTIGFKHIKLLLDRAKGTQYFGIIFTAIYTGMRRGELLGLRWQDIDFNNNRLYVSQTIQYVTGYGLIRKPPKSGKVRSISISSELIELLKSIREEQKRYKKLLMDEYCDQGLVFTQCNGKPFYPSELTRAFNKLVSEAGISKIRFHDLRHTHATIMLQQNVHAKVVSERLGHSTIGITLDIYSHVLPNMQEEAASRFEQAIKSGT